MSSSQNFKIKNLMMSSYESSSSFKTPIAQTYTRNQQPKTTKMARTQLTAVDKSQSGSKMLLKPPTLSAAKSGQF